MRKQVRSISIYKITWARLIILLLSFSVIGCINYYRYINAVDYSLNNYLKTSEIGTARSFKVKISFQPTDLIYELTKKKSTKITVKYEIIKIDKKEFYVHYYYNKMILADDVFSDDELIPVVRTEKDTIVGVGWKFLDSLKQAK